jgi:arylsulfatase A-like enzyme
MKTKILLNDVAGVATVSDRGSCSNAENIKCRLWLLLIVCVFATSALAQTAPPNIVVILADDLGYGDVGFNGCLDIPTPNIDSIAANGVLCTNGYVSATFCSPSRAGLLTGRYQERYGHDRGPTLGATNPRLGLPLTETILPQLLKPAGYICGAVGKWHLGYVPDLYPTRRGFDEFFGFLDAGSHYYYAAVLRNETPLIEPEYLTDAFTREGVDFINRYAARPFFLYLAYNAVHKPYDTPPQTYLDRVSYITDQDRQKYAAMTVALDDGVGQVLATLQAHNLLENTLIFFLSDNGAPSEAATDGDISNNAPFRGYKLNVLEGGIRIPFAVQWTGQLPAGAVFNDPVSSLDIVTTVAAVTGVSLPLDRVYDGLDILPYLRGDQSMPTRTLFWRFPGLGPNSPDDRNTIWAVRSGPLKLIVERAKDDEPPALYNLATDIGELLDLAPTQPQDVSALMALYDLWNLDTFPTIFRNNDDYTLLPLVLAGDWNGFNKDDLNSPWNLSKVSAPDLQGTPDAYDWLTNTIHVAVSGGDTTPGEHSFSLIGTGDYSVQWGGVPISIDGVTIIPNFSGNGLGPLNTITFDEGYYSFRILDLTQMVGNPLYVAVMKTSAPPIAPRRVAQTPVNPKPLDPIKVEIETSAPKSVEERIYVRLSTDSFVTSQMIEAVASGRNYSATIPPQPDGTLVLYTIMTSTADLTPYSTSDIIDRLTLATTTVFNAVPPVLPFITLQPADATVRAGTIAKFRVKAGGTKPLTYQWKKNGTNIPDAISATYKTPPTTSQDNGAVFSVLISDRAGSVISNNATLTVQ